MRGRKTPQTTMLSLVAPEQRVPKAHPLRRIEQLAGAVGATADANVDHPRSADLGDLVLGRGRSQRLRGLECGERGVHLEELFTAPPADAAVLHEEGWILGVP